MKEFFRYLKFAWKYAKGEKKKIIAYIIFNIITIAISVFVPIISAKIIGTKTLIAIVIILQIM